MEARFFFIVLCALPCILVYIIGLWRRKAGQAAFAAARHAPTKNEREYYCRLSVMAGHRKACRMYSLMHSEYFEDRLPLQPYRSKGVTVTFSGYYYPARYSELLDDEQRRFCEELYKFKNGESDGRDFFRKCLASLKTEEKPYHIMFMPCSSHEKYISRFEHLDRYITSNYPNLTSGFRDIEISGCRESLHKSKGCKNRKLSRNYRITGNISGKEIIIIDDVLTTGQSLKDYKREIEDKGAKVAAALFFGKTIEMPPVPTVRIYVWGCQIWELFKKGTRPQQ